MDTEEDDQAQRRAIVAQAIANVRARGLEPHPQVLALYERYAAGEIMRDEVQAVMQARAAAIEQGNREQKGKRD
ncbi:MULTISPECIES: antitoxin VbhA family protein [Hymenobacter]|uniref:Antitoxin VbhA domain-containing protein n=1 Tax=Hymenobacter wooponensis TaxID=1525360 RepID=A0A4Z0MAV3_9BACT|nr:MULTISPECIES: antitoxin VbhA family protein [Hymenobacter]RPD43572.1 hypothetical protein DNI29_23525 [Hymenobacter sediminis]TGD76604.1 hypothetical protein EU557_25260 [Hymenobacter wooponensis]